MTDYNVRVGNDSPSRHGFPGESRLNTNALGLWGLVIMGIAYMGLALTACYQFGIIEGITGPIVPLAFAAVTVAMLPTAASYAIMNSRRPSTGSTLTWLWEATTPSLGVWLGWVLVIAYINGCILQPVMFGLFFNSFLNFFGVHAGYLSATLAGFIPILIVGYMTKKDIRVSTKVIGWFIAIKAGFVALLALFIIIKQAIAGNLSFQPLNPTAATAGWTGFLNALLFAVLAIAAFDIVAPMAEETEKTPRRLVPRATIYVTIGPACTGCSPRYRSASIPRKSAGRDYIGPNWGPLPSRAAAHSFPRASADVQREPSRNKPSSPKRA